jgi:hypothetical protein
MLSKFAVTHKAWLSGLFFAAAIASSVPLQAAPVAAASAFQGGVFGTFGIYYALGDPGLHLQQVRFDLQSPLLLDPTLAAPGALLPFPIVALTGAAATGFAGAVGVVDGATSFTLLFNDFDVNEAFAFELDVDTPCASIFCQAPASLVTGSQFAGTRVTGTFGGPHFRTTDLTGIFAQTGPLAAQTWTVGNVEEVPEPHTIAMMFTGIALIAGSAVAGQLRVRVPPCRPSEFGN